MTSYLCFLSHKDVNPSLIISYYSFIYSGLLHWSLFITCCISHLFAPENLSYIVWNLSTNLAFFALCCSYIPALCSSANPFLLLGWGVSSTSACFTCDLDIFCNHILCFISRKTFCECKLLNGMKPFS